MTYFPPMYVAGMIDKSKTLLFSSHPNTSLPLSY